MHFALGKHSEISNLYSETDSRYRVCFKIYISNSTITIKINVYEFTFELRVLQRTRRDNLLKSLMIFYPPQNAANTNLCYNANCFTTLHYSFAEFT